MSFSSSPPSAGSSVLVISCSDARLTQQDAVSSWKNRLKFSGDIFEVRCPGGGLAMADKDSVFYLSALDSFILLSGVTHIVEVVLTFHEDCFYFTDKYGASPVGPSDDEHRKWHLIEEAMANVADWADGLQVRQLYLTFPHSHSRPDVHTAAEPARPKLSAMQPTAPGTQQRSSAAMRAVPGLPNERATLRAFDRQVEERLLHTNESAEDIIALAEGRARETGVMPTWRIERRALEFIALLRDEGKRSAQDIRQLVRAFVLNYAGNQLPRPVMRALLAEIDRDLQAMR